MVRAKSIAQNRKKQFLEAAKSGIDKIGFLY